MTFDEVQKRITEVCSKPDSAMVDILPVLEEIKKDYANLTSLTEKLGESDKRIRDLQDTNMKLFLMQTGQATEKETDDEDELEGMDAVDAFINKINKEET